MRVISLAVAFCLALVAPPGAAQVPIHGLDGDAGSGGDAPHELAGALAVAPGTVYRGQIVPLDGGDAYTFHADAGDIIRWGYGADGADTPVSSCMSILRPDGVSAGRTCGALMETSAAQTGAWYLFAEPPTPMAYEFSFSINAPRVAMDYMDYFVELSDTVDEVFGAPDLSDDFPAPAYDVGDDPTCGSGEPVVESSGVGSDGLVFAALKVGARAVVAWRTPEPVLSWLDLQVDGGAATRVEGTQPTTEHVFVVDGLPAGHALCFATSSGHRDALYLGNAMGVHPSQPYTINLLVLANEPVDVPGLRAALDGFAVRLSDATDGHVRAGAILLLLGDVDHHNTGWSSCFIPMVAVKGMTSEHAPRPPGCHEAADVIFTYNSPRPGATAAATYRDAIQRPDTAIWMNLEWQEGAADILSDDTAAVLTHEMGHYAFGALDLYATTAAVGGVGCEVPSLGLSIMGGDRTLTELDDAVNRCPNEADIVDYVPSWTLLMERFARVPDRAGVIDAGPRDAGDAYARHEFAFLPQLGAEGAIGEDDDAGSGRDAGSDHEGAVAAPPGALLRGTMLRPLDLVDYYTFPATAGDAVTIALTGSVCFSLEDAGGAQVASQCEGFIGDREPTWALEPIETTAPTSGAYFLRVQALGASAYAFEISLVPSG